MLLLDILLATALWTVLHIGSGELVRFFLPQVKAIDGSTRLVSFLFSLTVLPLSFYAFFFDKELQGDPLFSQSPLGYLITVLATGYFLWDVIICLYHFKQFKLTFLLHGLFCLLTYLGFFSHMMRHGVFYLFFEISSPFLSIGWLLEKQGVADSNWRKRANNIVFASFFFTARIIFGLVYSYWAGRDVQRLLSLSESLSIRAYCWFFFSSLFTLTLLNFYWAWMIAQGLRRKFQTIEETKTD